MFGEDAGKDVHAVESIYENICEIMRNNEETEANKNIFSCTQHFVNVSFNKLCPLCSGMVECYKTGIMKKMASNERCAISSRKLSSLRFTTLYNGISVRLNVTTDCSGCCVPSRSFSISSIPAIENINECSQLLVTNPLEFVENVVIEWVKRFFK